MASGTIRREVVVDSGVAGSDSTTSGTTAISVNTRSYVDVPVTFSKSFSEPPVVTVMQKSTTTSAEAGLMQVILSVSPTTSGFTARLINGSSSVSQGRLLYWVAIGT